MIITLRGNTKNRAISQYTNYFFDRGMVRIGDKIYGLNCESLRLLEGTDDDGTAISTKLKTGVDGLGDGWKHVRAIHVKGWFSSLSGLVVKYSMDSLSSLTTATANPFSKISSDGGGSIKFNGTRSKVGEHLSIEITNTSGAKSVISKIYAYVVQGRAR